MPAYVRTYVVLSYVRTRAEDTNRPHDSHECTMRRGDPTDTTAQDIAPRTCVCAMPRGTCQMCPPSPARARGSKDERPKHKDHQLWTLRKFGRSYVREYQ